MPGIAGFISLTAGTEGSRAVLDQMIGCMMHEPFYTSGTLLLRELGVAAGWVCHEGSYSDCLPIWNARKDVCLIFTGEHLADRADVDRLRNTVNGCSTDDARWLLPLYEETGGKFFEKLNGTFSGLLLDLRTRKAILFNDRYGLNRVYCHEGDDGFYFASEAKSLLKVLPQLRKLDMASLAEFFSCGCALQNRTLFSGITLLPGASAWTFAPRQPVKKASYFTRSMWENQPQLSASMYYHKLDATFTRILPRYFSGKQRVGLSLTGGLDSRMIISCAARPPHTLPCYTFGGIYRESADVKLAKRIARTSQQDHQTIAVTSQFFSDFPTLAEQSVYYADGAMDVTGSVELFANRIVRQIAPVRLTGNYGSELLRGNIAFKPVLLSEAVFQPEFIQLLKTAGTTYASEKNPSRKSFIAFKQVPWHHYGRLAVEQSQLAVRSPFLDNELVALAYQAPVETSVNKDLALRLIGDCNPSLAKIPTDRGRMSCGVSPSRFKLFWQEFMPRAEYIYDYGMPRWLAVVDRALSPLHMERLFLGRQKFSHFRLWYRHQLAPYVKQVLLDPQTLARPYLNGRHVEKIVVAHVEGRANYTLEIHKLLTSELIQRRLIEQGKADRDYAIN